MSSEADGDDAFSMHLGVLGRKELSFSERLRQARQLDALLESFSDAEDSGDDEWAGSVRSVSAALPRGTARVVRAAGTWSVAVGTNGHGGGTVHQVAARVARG